MDFLISLRIFLILQEQMIESGRISAEIIQSHRCLSIEELLDPAIVHQH